MEKQIEHELYQYADLVLTTGISLKKGQSVFIRTGPGTYYFARMLSQQAYRLGARYVQVEIDDNLVLKTRLTHLPSLDDIPFPAYRSAMLDEMLEHDWAHIRIEETVDTRALQDVEADALKAYTSAMNTLQRKFKDSLMNNEHPWCVICAPSDEWAWEVLGEDSDAKELWEVLKPILRLDREDPASAWTEHGDRLLQRCSTLDSLQLESLHITDSGTDLTIGLTPQAVWVGGHDTLAGGGTFFANIPTEEVFTVPDMRKTEGRVTLTMPVTIMDTLVEGAWLEFKNGKVVDYGAEKNVHILEQLFSLDEGASRLGEIALVDTSSPIYQSGRVFYSVLFDENAACHIALGQGYSGCLKVDPPALSEEDKKKYHCNVSMVHSDVMISSPGTCITGRSQDGRNHEIMKDGKLLV